MDEEGAVAVRREELFVGPDQGFELRGFLRRQESIRRGDLAIGSRSHEPVELLGEPRIPIDAVRSLVRVVRERRVDWTGR